MLFKKLNDILTMAKAEDILLQKLIRREFNRRQVDISSTQIQVFQGVVYIRGNIKCFQNYTDSQSLAYSLKRAIRTLPQVKDIIFD